MHHAEWREAADGPSPGWYLLQGQDLPRGLHQWEVRGEALEGKSTETRGINALLNCLVTVKPRVPAER